MGILKLIFASQCVLLASSQKFSPPDISFMDAAGVKNHYQSQLCQAAADGDLSLVNYLLNMTNPKLDPSRGDPSPRRDKCAFWLVHGSPLERAIACYPVKTVYDIVELLLDHGARVDRRVASHPTALRMAVFWGNSTLVKLLLKKGRADPNAKSSDGYTPMLSAAAMNRPYLIRILLASGADINQRSTITDAYGNQNTPLVMAFKYGHQHVFRVLLQNGADIDGGLVWASCHGQLAMARTLILSGADVNYEDHEGTFDTPLICAVKAKHLDLVNLLLSKGAEPNLENKFDQMTPLAHAVILTRPEIVRKLIEHGANVSARLGITQRSVDGANQPACHNPMAEYSDIVHVLFTNLTLTEDTSCTVFMEAILQCAFYRIAVDFEIPEILLQKGAKIDEINSKAETALHLAAAKDFKEGVEWLIRHGANVNARSADGSTPLITAARRAAVEVIPTLLENGADIDAVDKLGDTALLIAARNGNSAFLPYANVTTILRKAGANRQGCGFWIWAIC